jgi:hypothetical protein
LIRGFFRQIILLTVLSSCSPYVQYLEKQETQNIVVNKQKPKKLFCSKKPALNIIHDSEFTQIEFSRILQSLKETENYTITDLGLLLYFYQLKVRPDATDYNSRIQVIVRTGDELLYRDFFHQDENNLKNLVATLKSSKLTSRSLKQLIHDQRNHFPRKYTVQKKLNSFLDRNKTNESFLTSYKDSFFRIGKPLQKGETFRSTSVIKEIYNGMVSAPPPLFPLKISNNDGDSTLCNFDSKLYQKGIFLLSKEESNSNIFGLVIANGDSILFITSKDNSKNYKFSKKSFPGKATKSNASVCFHKGENGYLDLIGYNSRDPGQILYHLFNYGISNSQTNADVVEYLTFPRHQFLTNPSRLIYESKRGTKEQLSYFLSFDFPVYHVEKLAGVNALFGRKKTRTFIGDPRITTLQSCTN